MTNFDSQNTESTLFVDIGNSATKVAFRSGKDWTVRSYKSVMDATNQINNHPYPVYHIVICSVKGKVKSVFESKVESHLIKSITVNDIKPELIDYETPETLGMDRYLACYGAQINSNNAVVVIDAGSACTIDYMDEHGIFKGGIIMPGLSSIRTIFKDTAPELPEVGLSFPAHFPGKSTHESLELGLIVFYVDGLLKMLERYTNNYGAYDLVICGGDAETVNQLIGNIGEVKSNVLFEGMEKLILG